MSFFGMGGRPQISSEQKIAQAEAEIDMVSDMYSRYKFPSFTWFLQFLEPPTQYPFSPSLSNSMPHILTHTQTPQILQLQMHRLDLPRSRPEQGRIRLSRPLRRQVLRSQRESEREDAGRGARPWRRRRNVRRRIKTSHITKNNITNWSKSCHFNRDSRPFRLSVYSTVPLKPRRKHFTCAAESRYLILEAHNYPTPNPPETKHNVRLDQIPQTDHEAPHHRVLELAL